MYRTVGTERSTTTNTVTTYPTLGATLKPTTLRTIGLLGPLCPKWVLHRQFKESS